jgi:hypothetical protein
VKRTAVVAFLFVALFQTALFAEPLDVKGMVAGVFPVGNQDNMIEFKFGTDLDLGLEYLAPQSVSSTPYNLVGTVDDGDPLALALGSFNLYRPDLFQPQFYLDVPFRLDIFFTQPTVVSQPTFLASLWGAVAYLPGGFVNIDFAENEKYLPFSTSTGTGALTLRVNDLSICLPAELPFRNDPRKVNADLSGEIRTSSFTAVPEPAAFEILGAALIGIATLLRKRV